MTDTRDDRIAGLLVGLAAGDRIGGPIRMAIRVAESLHDCHGLDESDIGRRYLEWWRHGAFDTGPTVAEVLKLVESGFSFNAAAARVDAIAGGMTAGCNPAHRNAPLALCAAISDSNLAEAAEAEALLTHVHPLAGDVAAAAVRLCRALVSGMPWPTALTVAAAGRLPETRRALAILPIDELSPSGFAPDVLGAAIHFVDTSTSFADALAWSIRFAGPANYCPVLVGSIGGARWGADMIDEELVAHHSEVLPRISSAAAALCLQWRANEDRRPQAAGAG